MNTTHRPQPRARRGPSPLTAIALLAVAAALLVRPLVASAFSDADDRLVDRIETINDLVNKTFFTDPDTDAMRDGAISGMLEALGDQYTQYIPPARVDEFRKLVSGDYVGIGAEVRESDGFLTIISPMDDSPALRAGLQADDLVVAVNGNSVFRLGTDSIIDALLGDPNTTVTVTIERDTDAPPTGAAPASVPGPVELDPQTHTRRPVEPNAQPVVFLTEPITAPGPKPGHTRFDVTITRQRIMADTVKGLHRDADQWRYFADPERKIAYVRITSFTQETMAALPKALLEIERQGANALVLDLRFNSGGSLQAAVVLSDLFLDAGTIVSTKGRAEPERVFRADPRAVLPDLPIAVLINAASASASEILAGALKDNDRAIVVGERSLGKGLVQSVYELPRDHGELKLTTARYYLPSGRNINRDPEDTVWGVDPSDGFYVPIPIDEAIDTLVTRRNEEIRRPEPDQDPELWQDAQRIRERLADRQLDAAVDALAVKLDTGAWQPTGQPIDEDGLALADLQDLREQQQRLFRELERVARRISDLDDIAGADDVEASDLLPDDAALTGGTVTVRDAEGNTLSTLTITAETLERWLIDAPLEPVEPDEPTAMTNTPEDDNAEG